MKMPICIVYHCLFYMGTPPQILPGALSIVSEQIGNMRVSGLLEACDEMIVGCNGGSESIPVATALLPKKAKVIMHGLQSRAENLTIVEIEKWAPSHPGWAILYLHAKGCTHKPTDNYAQTVSKPWRQAMMADLVLNWKDCVQALKVGNDVVCSHFMRGMGSDGSQNIAAGNFWWAKSDFISTLPSIYLRDRIKVSGIASAESRYEAEVWLGNGRMPRVHEWRPNGGGGCP